MREDSDTGVAGDGRRLAAAAFPDDDGKADPALRALMRNARSTQDLIAISRSLRDVRLLATVVAVLDSVGDDGTEKDSHMAVVSMVNDAGDKGLLAFTGVDSLSEWNPEARPVPAWGRDVARGAVDDGASAVIIDVAGPQRIVLEGLLLDVLADQLDLTRLDAQVQAALAPLTADGWLDAHVVDVREEQAEVDVVVRLVAVGSGHPDGRLLTDLAQQAAGILGSRPEFQKLAPGGIGVAVG